MDSIILKGLRFYAYHGVLPEEREQGQEFVVDVVLHSDLRNAARSDDLAQSVDYRHVYDRTREVMEGPPRHLLEALAESIASRLLELHRVTGVTVSVRKPGVRLPGPLDYSEVTIHRQK